ncbi:MAG: homocysteine S-methyltransferase family protein [Desulfosarcina sp.]|nr:homocysteine S-methyltransferase family protein [Desulfobacterales bacterium]
MWPLANPEWCTYLDDSAKSHAELDEAEAMDDGDPVEFGRQYRALMYKLSHLNVLGGCCGADIRHIEEICKAGISRQV